MKQNKKLLMAILWSAAGASLILFVATRFNAYAFLSIFVTTALALAWWGMNFPITETVRRNVHLGVVGFWTVVFVLLFAPFPIPKKPQYVVGEVHRFSEMEHGWGRMYAGALGPQIANHGRVYTDPEEVNGIGGARGKSPSFVTGYPFARSVFGGASALDGFRGVEKHGGEPAAPTKYPWVNYEGEARGTKLGWNKGDMLLPEVAKQLGYEKARYTPEENALMIKGIGKWLGSMDVAIAEVDPRWFYSHDFITKGTPLPLEEVKELKYAIQLFVDQDWTRVHNDPGNSWWSVAKSGQAYSTSAWQAVRLAAMLRDMGYVARVGFGGINYDSAESPISVYSGKGEYGRLSDAVVPSAGGLRFKSASVLTNFPLKAGDPDQGYGITRMCSNCDRCARACPVSSIAMGEPTVENGVNMWQVDKDKCVRFRAGNLGGNCCNECLRVCPYNKPDTLFHKLGNYMIAHSPLAPFLFGNIKGVGLEDWLDFDYSSEAGHVKNRPARWVQENPGFKMQFPYHVGNYIYTEEDRSTAEEWAAGEGAKMGKVGLTYKGVEWGKIESRLLDANGRSRNVHHDFEKGELPKDLALPGKTITKEEAQALLESGQAFTGGSNHPDSNVFPPRSKKYEKGVLTYKEAAKMWKEEK